MAQHLSQVQITAVLAGDTSAKTAAARKHLKTCAKCQRRRIEQEGAMLVRCRSAAKKVAQIS